MEKSRLCHNLRSSSYLYKTGGYPRTGPYFSFLSQLRTRITGKLLKVNIKPGSPHLCTAVTRKDFTVSLSTSNEETSRKCTLVKEFLGSMNQAPAPSLLLQTITRRYYARSGIHVSYKKKANLSGFRFYKSEAVTSESSEKVMKPLVIKIKHGLSQISHFIQKLEDKKQRRPGRGMLRSFLQRGRGAGSWS